jgi:CspA family cold shock protein
MAASMPEATGREGLNRCNGSAIRATHVARREAVSSEDEDMAATMTGTIKRLVSDKGFGFVAAGEGSEYFFHQSACNGVQFDDLREGQEVTFETGEGPKGPRAENVRLA